jgi:HK97 family phage major capsid protein
VLFGEIPTDDENAAIYYRKTRAIFSPAYGEAFARYHKTCVKYRNETMAFNSLTGAEQKALSEGTDTAGGFIVPPDIQAEMLVRLPQKAIMRQFARVQPTNRDVLRWPAVKGNAGTYSGISGASIYSSGFIGSWAGETPAFSDTDPGFQTLDIAIKKVRVATRLSNDFVSDAAVNIMAFLAQNGAENMALTEDQGFFTGDGSSLVPMGLLNAGITTVDLEGSTADTISNTATSTGSAPKLINLTYKLPPQYLPGARWIMRRSIQGKIRQLVDGNSRFMWPAYTESGFAGPIDTLMGYPVSQTDWMPDDGQDTQPVVAFGDFSHYIIGQRTQITSLVLRERFADSDQVGIILFERVGGGLYNTDAFRLGIC